MASRSAYGSNPHAGINPNADHGWGGYQWPGGVPSSLLATATYRGSRSTASCLCRRELVELFELVWEIADKRHNYPVFGKPNPSGEPTWGPWGYENRPIGGTSTASNHSRGKAMDINAPRNPQSYTFQSDMPPGMVADFEACGFYWGGRYEGVKYDAMHFEYAFSPADVAGHIARARAILGREPAKPNPDPTPAKPGNPTPKPAPTNSEDEEMALSVIRCGEIDYAYSKTTGVFFQVRDPDHYTFLTAGGFITTPHGEAPTCDGNLLGFIREECARAAGLGPVRDGQPLLQVEGYAPKA